MEKIPGHKGTLSVGENKLASIVEERQHLETERAKFAARVVEAHKGLHDSEFRDLHTLADAAELEDLNAHIERLKNEEAELRTLLDQAKAA